MKARGARVTLGALLVAAACAESPPPRAEWEVYLGTDAPVPAFGEVLAVELTDAAGNPYGDDGVRLFDASRPSAWPFSFGILPSSGAPPRLRARLYRLDQVGAGVFPDSSALIDATATLPPAVGLTVVALPLMMSCFGVAPDVMTGMSCDPATGKLAPEPALASGASPGALPVVGSWLPGRVVPCTGAEPGMICIPGGAFLMGSVRSLAGATGYEPVPEHLVQLSPFSIDVDEMTVGQVRELVVSKGLPPPEEGDFQSFDSPNGPCTYAGADDASHDAYPITCIPWASARQACELLGKRLPTEAEWEYVAGNLTAKTPFPWGADTDICAHAVVARGRVLVEIEAIECLDLPDGTVVPSGPQPGGSDEDRTALGVKNLGGNVNEWVDGYFQPYSSPCWNTGLLLKDPDCEDSSGGQRSIRGGDWVDAPASAASYFRDGTFGGQEVDIQLGFRCAK
jgi:formylglycine-generating enzyme required for sulfatase activity